MPKTDTETIPRVRTQQALAAVYCVEQQTISEWVRNKEAPFPKKGKDGWNLEEVGRWYDENKRKSKQFEAARARKMAADAEKQEMAVAQMKKESIPASHVEKQWSAGFAALRSEMQKTARTLSPQVSGKDAAECLKAIEARDRKVLNTISHVEADL